MLQMFAQSDEFVTEHELKVHLDSRVQADQLLFVDGAYKLPPR